MFTKKKLLVLLVGLTIIIVMLTSCGSKEPCESCGQTPTNDYKNELTGEKMYYCDDCSSDCGLCPKEATNYYTSAAGMIIFVCDDCYEEIKKLNNY